MATDNETGGSLDVLDRELEKLLEGMAVPRIHSPSEGHPLTPSELRSPHSKAWAEELVANAKKVARFEKASAALTEEMGDAAEDLSVCLGRMQRIEGRMQAAVDASMPLRVARGGAVSRVERQPIETFEPSDARTLCTPTFAEMGSKAAALLRL
jgi:hypothetical protein